MTPAGCHFKLKRLAANGDAVVTLDVRRLSAECGFSHIPAGGDDQAFMAGWAMIDEITGRRRDVRGEGARAFADAEHAACRAAAARQRSIVSPRHHAVAMKRKVGIL